MNPIECARNNIEPVGHDGSSTLQKILRCVAISLMVAMALEVLVFNFPFWESLLYGNAKEVDWGLGPGLEIQDDGTIKVVDPETAYIEFDADGCHVENLYLDIAVPGWASSSWRTSTGPYLSIKVLATDEANSSFFELPSYNYCGGMESSNYLRLHLSGVSHKMRVLIQEESGFSFDLRGASINAMRPFCFEPIRFGIAALLACALLAFRPSSSLYRTRLFPIRPVVIGCIVALMTVEMAGSVVVSRLSGVADNPANGPIINGPIAFDFNQYNHLADAFLSGKVSLDLPVSAVLSDMENPYDTSARAQELSQAGEYYYLDYAFYNGRYYSYFGALPALVAFVPFKLLTGRDLRTDQVVLALGVIFICAFNALLYCLAKRYRRDVSLGLFALSSVSFFVASGLLYLVFLPQIYSVPILSGLIVVFLGLSCWVSAERLDGDHGGFRKSYLMLGSFLIALSLGCRPQYVLVSLLAFPIFWNAIFRERLFFSKKGASNTVSVIAPFILVAIPVMLYNGIRFGSVFDFGAAYNLTGSDMTSRGIDLSRSLPALFQYLLQPLNICARYPYVFGVDMAVDYQGYWFYEPYLGGLLAIAPFLLVGLACIPSVFSKSRQSQKAAIIFSLIVASVILFADFQIASITMRYFSDFSWLLILLVFGVLLQTPGFAEGEGVIFRITVPLIGLTIFLGFWILLSPDRYGALASTCPSVFYGVAQMLCLV